MRCTPVSRVAVAASVLLVGLVGSAGLVAWAPSVTAAPYPPQPGAPPTGVLGVSVGGTITPAVCGFAPGTTVSVTIDGQAAGSAAAGNSACVTVTITVSSTTTAVVGGVALGALSSGATYRLADYQTVSPGAVQFSADGLQAAAGTIAITCGANSVVGTGTGSNGAATTSATTFSVLCATAKSGIVFTGANSARELEFGGGLFLVGAVVLVAHRRRERRRA